MIGHFVIMLAAMVFDRLFGEPRILWDNFMHPVVAMGKVITLLTKKLNTGQARKAKGFFVLFCLVFGAWALGLLIAAVFWPLEVFAVFTLLAHKSLIEHMRDVAQKLRISLGDGRASVAMIVGRDTNDMTADQVARAAIESGAENFSDGFIASVFWYLVAGLPGLMIYKTVNTADSMIGYKTPEFSDFGYASAKCDDVLNFIPARLTALLLYIANAAAPRLIWLRAQAGKHRSPNAGWPEAAMADVLGIALSGPRSYHGQMQDFEWVNGAGRKDIAADDIEGAIGILNRAWWGLFAFIVLSVTGAIFLI